VKHPGKFSAAFSGLSVLICCWIATPAHADKATTASWQDDYRLIELAITKRSSDSKQADLESAFLLDAQAKIHPTDRDPLDVELRRWSALLGSLARLDKAPDLSESSKALDSIRTRSAKLDPATDAVRQKRRELYITARSARRMAALSNPLLDFDEILLTTGRPGGSHIQSHFYGKGWGNNQVLALTGFKTGKPRVRDLLRGVKASSGRSKGQTLTGGRSATLDLSYDGSELLFEWVARKPPADYGEDSILNPSHMTPDMTYNVWKLNLQTRKLSQLTDTMYNDSCPAWLPNGRIVFISDRRGAYVRCHGSGPPERPFNKRSMHQPCATMHTMKADGSDVIPISWHETSETFPRVANDGSIVYTRWDYVDREFHAGHHIWFCMPDGRDPRGPHGNYPLPHDMMGAKPPGKDRTKVRFHDGRTLRPWAEYCIRPIPGSRKFIAVASTHHHSPEGHLIVIDPSVPDDGKMAQVRQVHPGKLPNEAWKADRKSMQFPYAWPWPLNEDYWIVSDIDRKALVLMDRFGNRDVLWSGQALLAIPRKARPRPLVIPTRTFQGERAKLKERSPATIAVMNVYEADFDWPVGTKIKALRIVQIFPRPWSSPFSKVGWNYSNGAINRMPLGVVPVEEDGSAYFEAPVECEIYFQALDADGLAVQSMRSGTYVHPGEQLTCIGCHEDKWKARGPMPKRIALGRKPSKMTPEVGGLEPINYYRLVKPVLDEKCVGCHRKEKKGIRDTDYRKLEPYAFYFHGSGGGNVPLHGGYRTTAGKFGARWSRMGRMLMGKRHQGYLAQGKFTRQDVRRICLWLDLNSMELGSSSIDPADQATQRAGKIVWPKLDFDPKNPQRTERSKKEAE